MSQWPWLRRFSPPALCASSGDGRDASHFQSKVGWLEVQLQAGLFVAGTLVGAKFRAFVQVAMGCCSCAAQLC